MKQLQEYEREKCLANNVQTIGPIGISCVDPQPCRSLIRDATGWVKRCELFRTWNLLLHMGICGIYTNQLKTRGSKIDHVMDTKWVVSQVYQWWPSYINMTLQVGGQETSVIIADSWPQSWDWCLATTCHNSNSHTVTTDFMNSLQIPSDLFCVWPSARHLAYFCDLEKMEPATDNVLDEQCAPLLIETSCIHHPS